VARCLLPIGRIGLNGRCYTANSMAAPGIQNLTFVRGDTETVQVTMTSDGAAPVNITGRTYASQLRTSPDISAISASATCSITDAANGVMTVLFTATSTATLDPGYYYWDLQETNGATVTTVLQGTVNVLPDVTRV
jgi:hypothetical protein